MTIIDQTAWGMVIRVFAKTPDQVEGNAKLALAAANKAETLCVGEKPLYKKILILVPADPNYPDCDCGETAAYLRRFVMRTSRIEVREVSHGDLFCGVLNYGLARLTRAGCDYMTVLSPGASGYLSVEEMLRAADAFDKGAKVAGVALDELAESVLAGRIANTFATWDTVALATVGGFDLRASQPRRNDPTALYAHGVDADGKDVFYPQAGVEEILPLTRLVKLFGKCLAPMRPLAVSTWVVPDPVTDPEGALRHKKKLGTKFERQLFHAAYLGTDFSVLRSGVMDDYRT